MKILLALYFALISQLAYAQSATILMFHHLVQNDRPGAHESVQIGVFEEYLKMIKAGGYKTVTISELTNMIKQKRVPQKVVALTFDDGWRSHIEAMALLDKYNLKGTFYVLSGSFGDPSYLSKEEMRKLASNQNAEIGAHTHTHLMKWEHTLDQMEDSIVIGEMFQSKTIVEEVIGKPVTSFAWPFGYVRVEARDLGPAMGFTSIAETNRQSKNSNEISPWKLQRLNIAGTCSPAQVKGMIDSGLLNPCK